jgi:disulfide bond formation protein DsbB
VTDRYGERPRRPLLVAGIIGAVVCLVGAATLGGGVFTLIRFLVAILALILAWMSVQYRAWWWAVPLAAMAVLWNPVIPIDLPLDGWRAVHYIGAALFLTPAVLVRVHPEGK